MAAEADLDSLRGLYQDLTSLSRFALPSLERLIFALETTIGDFKKLLDKPIKNDGSRKKVLSGTIRVDDIDFQINSEFQQDALQIADALNVDELLAAKLFIEAQQISSGSPAVLTAIIRFHERRAFLLECLRLIFQESFEDKGEARALMQDCVAKILDIEIGPLNNGSNYVQKCLTSMADIEHWLVLLGEQVEKAAIVGSAQDADVVEVIEYQRHSLERQHESLGAIVTFLFKGAFTTPNDLLSMISRLQKLNRVDSSLVHYVPAIIAGFTLYGSPEGPGTRDDAKLIHKSLTTTESSKWQIPKLCAAVTLLWLSEYGSWTADATNVPSPMAKKKDQPLTKLEESFKTALDDGALEFLLALCARAQRAEQSRSNKSELVALLLKDDENISGDQFSFTEFFFFLLMDYIEMFTQSLITNMPDAIRHLKAEEDSQRLDQITALREGLSSVPGRSLTEVRMHFESLLVIMAFAFEKREDAAQAVWAEPDGNMYGFLQFTSKRQTVPTASAFCELLCSLSEGEDNAAATHKFLLGEDDASAKFRRPTHLGWLQMLSELEIYAAKATEKPTPAAKSVLHMRTRDPTEIDEPESPVMLTSYLRLISHLCEQSGKVRGWVLQNESHTLTKTLLDLASAPIPNHLRASIFLTLKSMMIKKSSFYEGQMWYAIDRFASTTNAQSALPTRTIKLTTKDDAMLQRILEGFDQTVAFIELLGALVSPATDMADAQMCISFPQDLGQSYRSPGIEPYIDFVMGQAFAGRLFNIALSEEESRKLQYSCLNFAAICLESFNESLVLVAKDAVDHYSTYVQLHPFARVMEWFFNEGTLRVLFSISRQDIREIEKSSPNSLLVLCLGRVLHVMNLVLNLQATYLDVVRPLLKTLPNNSSSPLTAVSLSSFEESVMDHITLISDLCIYAGAMHPPLTLVSLSLLENLATSKKLNQLSSTIHGWQFANPLVDIINSQVDMERLAAALSQQMRIDVREIECGPTSAGYLIKSGLAHLLDSCLAMNPSKPSIAHALLGFSCNGSSLDVTEDISNPKMALLQSVVAIVQAFPVSFDGINISSWMMRLKRSCFQVLKRLSSSKLSSGLILPELRASDLFTSLFTSQPPVTSSTLWDGHLPTSPAFWEGDSSLALSELLSFRGLLFSYAATELRYTAQLLSPSFVRDFLNTALGSTTGPTNQIVQHASLFDLFDFADLDLDFILHYSSSLWTLRDFDNFLHRDEATDLLLYDIQAADEFFEMNAATAKEVGEMDAAFAEVLATERKQHLYHFRTINQSRIVRHNRYLAVKAWAELAATIVLVCDMDPVRKSVFILHVLQAILPKLEASLDAAAPEALELSRLAEMLIEKLGSTKQTGGTGGGDIIDEQLSSLFETCINGVTSVLDQTELRSCLYSICSRYLQRITASAPGQCMEAHQTVQASGPAVIEAICDDAYTGEDACRISALLLLEHLTMLDFMQGSSLIIDSMTRLNHLAMFVDVLRSMPDELQHSQPSEVPQLLVYYQTHLTFLFGLARTRLGAERLVEAGIFQAAQDSQLFSADPDIGIEIHDHNALREYHNLLLAVLRVIVATVFSRGPETHQIREQTQSFLKGNRPNIIGILKRQARFVPTADTADEAAILDELLKAYTALMAAVEFSDYEETPLIQPRASVHFS